ncbi:MAG: alpha/beta hydrolase [Chloroflexota bacterium]|nr:alpha/beta hydrolase [Chloroflexota bacterium]
MAADPVVRFLRTRCPPPPDEVTPMPFMPLSIISTWLLGLLSLGLFGGGLYILWAWYAGALVSPAWPAVSLVAFLWSFTGRSIVLRFRRPSRDEPRHARGGLMDRIERLDGSSLHVELDGPVDGPPVILTHGNGMAGTAWYYQRRKLAERFRLIVWDLPGCGRSRGPATGDYRPEKLARDLGEIVALAGGHPAILVGHGLGGMLALTYCKLFPEKVGREVAGLVLVDTAPANPVHATPLARRLSAVVTPLLYLTVWLSPVVKVMNWLSYHNGMLHLQSMLTGFAGGESRGQLDFATSFTPLASPGETARATLALCRYDASDALPRIDVPALVVTGDQDRVIVPETARRLVLALPRATLVTLRPGGHLALLEQHEALTRALAAFASEHGAVELGSASRRRR